MSKSRNKRIKTKKVRRALNSNVNFFTRIGSKIPFSICYGGGLNASRMKDN